MEVGTLVRRKWVTHAQRRRALKQERIVDEIGLVVHLDFINPRWCMVWFSTRDVFKECLRENLEVISER